MTDHDSTAGPPRPRVGQDLGRYRLEALLGEGGMASVYRARHKHMDRTVAIKALHPEAAHNPDAVARFLREAKAVAALHHRHIVSIADAQAGTAEHPPYLVLEYLSGQLLSSRLAREIALPVKETLRLTGQMADALSVAHQAGIVHRDMKPENIMLVPDGEGGEEVKLLDFGLAKFLLPVDDLRTAEGLQVGTPEYLAPEQVRGSPVGPFTDIYALGCLVYVQLTGVPPFEGTWLGEICRRILREDPAPPSKRRPPGLDPVPAALDALVLRCLSKEPAGRFSSMEEFTQALELVSSPGTGPPASMGDESTGSPRGPWRRILHRLRRGGRTGGP